MANAPSIELLSPPEMFRGQTYEHAAVVGDLVFLAGQVSRDAAGDTVAPNDTAGQTVQLYANLRRVLEFAGCAPADVVKVTTYLVDAADTQIVLTAHQQFFGTHRPPHTLVTVHSLTRPDMRMEVDAIALRRRAEGAR